MSLHSRRVGLQSLQEQFLSLATVSGYYNYNNVRKQDNVEESNFEL